MLKRAPKRLEELLLPRKTSRERPKSASYLRLQNIQGTTIVKFFNYSNQTEKYPKRFSRNSKTASYFPELETSEKKLTCFCKKIQKTFLAKK